MGDISREQGRQNNTRGRERKRISLGKKKKVERFFLEGEEKCNEHTSQLFLYLKNLHCVCTVSRVNSRLLELMFDECHDLDQA